MFNLEQRISDWRRHMHSVGLKNSDTLDELESHLRDDFASRVGAGESEDNAFAAAIESMGAALTLKNEFAKVPGKNMAWLRKLKRLLAEKFSPVPSLAGFSPSAIHTLQLAGQEAPRLHHNFIGTEHVLLGLLALEDSAIPAIFRKLQINRETVRREIEKRISAFPITKSASDLPFTPRVKKSLHFAAKEAGANPNAVGPEHILLGLLLESEGVAGRVLRDLGLTPQTLRQFTRQTQK